MKRLHIPSLRRGFTLVEALGSAMIVALAAGAVAALFMAGLQSLDAQSVRAQIDSDLRGRMEALLSTRFDQLSGGSDTLTIEGTGYAVTWSVTAIDLDGDTIVEADAKRIDLTVGGRTLSTIVVDSAGQVGKG